MSTVDSPFLSIAPELFERQLAALRRMGYRSGDGAALGEMLAGVRRRDRLAFLTFDDGFVDTYTTAWPLLRQYRFRACTFLVTGQMGAPFRWPEIDEYARRAPEVFRSMSWTMAEEMAESGIEFGSHTCAHAHLTTLGDDELAQELLDSRTAIKERLGRCDLLAYPFGDWDLRVALAAAKAGYRCAMALSPTPRSLTTAMSVPRIVVDHRDEPARFRLKLSRPGRLLLTSELSRSLKEILRAGLPIARR